MKEEKSNFRLYIVALSLILAICLFFLINERSIDLANLSSRQKTITARQVRDDIFDFVTTVFFKLEENGDLKVWSHQNCSESDQCSTRDLTNNPIFAWSLLLLAQGTVDYKGADNARYETAKDLLDKVYREWSSTALIGPERYSLHQLYEIADLTNDASYNEWVSNRYPFMMMTAKNLSRQSRANENNSVNSYLLSTMARQLVFSLKLKISSHKTAFNSHNISETTDVILSLIKSAEHDIENGIDSSYPEIFGNSDFRIGQMSCFPVWAKTAYILKLQNEDEIRASKVGTKFENDVEKFFKNLHKASTEKDLNFLNLQSILPCVHSVSEYLLYYERHKSENINLKEYTMMHEVLEDLLLRLVNKTLSTWDRYKTACGDHGGFFSELERKTGKYKNTHTLCKREKTLVDNSWLSFILGTIPEKFKFSVER